MQDANSAEAAGGVLAGLDPEQREAAMAVRGPVCILAGAGTGKPRAITHRIAYAVRTEAIPPSQLLAVTFTARAAGELRGRLRARGAHGVQARTFHAAALRQLQYFAPRILGGGTPEVVDNPMRLVGNAAARLRLRVDRAELRDLAAEIDWAKAVLATPDGYPATARAAGRETTSTPETRLSASSVMKLSVKPSSWRNQKVGIAESGIASAEMTVARRSRRNRKTITTASTAPSIIARIAAL